MTALVDVEVPFAFAALLAVVWRLPFLASFANLALNLPLVDWAKKPRTYQAPLRIEGLA